MKAQLLCAWCGRLLRWTVTTDGQPSHGICKECSRRVLIDAGLLIDDEQEDSMHSGEIEYEFNEGATNRTSSLNPRQESIVMASNGLAILYREFGQAAMDEAIRRATVTLTATAAITARQS